MHSELVAYCKHDFQFTSNYMMCVGLYDVIWGINIYLLLFLFLLNLILLSSLPTVIFQICV